MVKPIGSQIDWGRLLTVAVGRLKAGLKASRQGKAL